MPELQDQLIDLKHNKTKRIKGKLVKRDRYDYLIDGDTLTLEEATKRLSEVTSRNTIDYNATAFVEKTPHSDQIVKIHRLSDKSAHTMLISAVKSRHNYLWYGAVTKVDGRYFVNSVLLLDFDSVPDPGEEEHEWDGGLSCPFCSVGISSASGRTLHIKSGHPDRLDDYFRLLDDLEMVSDESLMCPYCKCLMKSRFGRTNHVKAKHPEMFEEYRNGHE